MKPNEHPNAEMPEIDSGIPENAVSIYGQSDAMDDFPVLKAFQQYIDSEQAKARKRMLMLCVFFGALMVIVITVFLMLLMNVSTRNQTLNDRLIEYAMKERERMASPIVVQPQQQQDNSAILALTAKIEDMQKKLAEGRVQADEARRQVELEAAKPKGPTPEELEIKRLSALLAAEKEKQAAEKARMDAEKERQRQIELEEYRRKHYPELYEKNDEDEDVKPLKRNVKRQRRKSAKADRDKAHEDLLKEIDEILDDGDAISYYDEDDEDEVPKTRTTKKIRREKPEPVQKEYSIPVDIKGSSSRWSIPND